MIIDTHCHLDFDQFNPDRESVIERAEKAGVKYIVNVGSSLEGTRKCIELASTHENIFASAGIHPHHAEEVTEGVFAEIGELAKTRKVVAIGEVGLDYFKSPSAPEEQKRLFLKFIELSKVLKLPLIIHSRDASRDVLEILEARCDLPVQGVMHCFSADKKLLEKVLKLGLFISFTCNLTFRNAGVLREVARHVPLECLLLETDAPFLAPQKYRGRRNEPAYITELRDILSEILDLPKDEIERVTTENAKKLFGVAD